MFGLEAAFASQAANRYPSTIRESPFATYRAGDKKPRQRPF